MRAFWAFAGLALLGCRSVPRDDLEHAEVLALRGDLVGSLQRLDSVPAANPRYSQARAIAQATERRVRTTHELVSDGLRLRAEWRDDEAIARFEQALEIWPEHELAARMLAATHARVLATDGAAPIAGEVRSGVVLETRPVGVDPPGVPVDETGSLDGVERDEPEAELPAASPAWVAEIDRHLERGSLEQALLLVERGRLPMASSPTRMRLVQRLHQRALVHYGHGRLDFALNDWVRLLRIDPRHAAALEFTEAARAEREARDAREARR